MAKAEIPVIIKPHHADFLFGGVHSLYLLNKLPINEQLAWIKRRSQRLIEDPSAYDIFGGASDLIGDTPEERGL